MIKLYRTKFTPQPSQTKLAVPKSQTENLHIVKFFTLGYKFSTPQIPY